MEQLHAYVTEPQATENHKTVYVYTGTVTVSQGWLYKKACYMQAGPAHAAGRGDGMNRQQHFSHLLLDALPVASIALYSGVK